MKRTQYIAQYKRANPIHDCPGSGTGRYKYRTVQDCIDLRYGFATLRQAQLARAAEARRAWDNEQSDKTVIACPVCGANTTRRVLQALGQCLACDMADVVA